MCDEPLTGMGYFGKLPARGDFVGAGLPRAFIEPWDSWLQEAMHISQVQLGEKWLDYFLTSPVYRFALSPGICGKDAWLGVIMPSVDKIGRYYPLTVCRNAGDSSTPFSLLQNQNDWLASVEALLLSCLQDDFQLAAFRQKIFEIGWGEEKAQTGTAFWNGPNKCFSPALKSTLPFAQPIAGLSLAELDQSIRSACQTYSLWWTQGSQHIPPSLFISHGLPALPSVAAMFDGNWQVWGWQEHLAGEGNHE